MKRKKYTQEFKQQTIKLVTEQGYSISEAAKNLNIPHGNINRWLAESSQGSSPMVKPKLSGDQEELNRLRKENHRLKQEREILKKAAAFFANELN